MMMLLIGKRAVQGLNRTVVYIFNYAAEGQQEQAFADQRHHLGF